jgi:hypothetical protein
MIAGRDPWGFLGADTNGSTSADPRLAPLPYAAKEMIACTVVMATLAAILVGLRIYCRAFIVRAMGKDDWAILVALVCSK